MVMSRGESERINVSVDEPIEEGVRNQGEAAATRLFPGAVILLRVPTFSGEVEIEILGDHVTLRHMRTRASASGSLSQLRVLAVEALGLSEKDLLVLRVAMERLGVRTPGPPLPLDVVEVLPRLTPPERLEVVGWLQPGDLGVERLLSLAVADGWMEEGEVRDIKKAVKRVPPHARAYYAARLLEEWGLLRLVAVRLSPEGEQRGTGESFEGRCVVVGDNLLYPLEVWESVAARFFLCALTRETLSYVRNHTKVLATREVPLDRVNPWHLLRLRGWVLDLRDIRLLPPSLADHYFTYEVDLGVSDEELQALIESIRRGDYAVELNRIYELWRRHFEDGEWEFFVDAVGTFLSPFKFRLIVFLVGERGCGKTSLLAAVTKAIDPLVGRVPLSKLADERFALQPLIGKWVNVYSEQLKPTLKNLEVLNNLVGENDWIYVDRKHKPPLWIRSLKTMVFAGNAVPLVTSWSEGPMDAFIDRLSIIEVRAPEGFKPEKDVAERVPKVDGLAFLLWARRQLEEKGWRVSKRSEEELIDMLMTAHDYVAQFIEEVCIRDEHGRVDRTRLYDAFKDWLKQRRITRVPSRADFYSQVRSLGFKERKHGDKRYFLGLRLSDDEAQRELSRFDEH